MNTSSTVSSVLIAAPDLRKRAPRSLRCRLGGYAVLPRLLDKCRADLAGTVGEYHTNCPLDQQFLGFTGVNYHGLRAELARGKSDSEILAWIVANSATPRTGHEIEAWSRYQDGRLPSSDAETTEFFAKMVARLSSTRPDIHSWADVLDLDDHVSFGGTA